MWALISLLGDMLRMYSLAQCMRRRLQHQHHQNGNDAEGRAGDWGSEVNPAGVCAKPRRLINTPRGTYRQNKTQRASKIVHVQYEND